MTTLEVDRERTIQLLCTHFANDNLTTQELELRFERVYKAQSAIELQGLVAGLPVLPPTIAAPQGMFAVAPTQAPAPEKRWLVLMSEVKKRGEWTPAQRNKVRAIMGNMTLDLRDAHLAPGVVTEFDISAIMSEVKVIVPPGLAVECDGMAIMGEFDDATTSRAESSNAPRIRITGSAVMASVHIKTRLPGETSLAAWKRQLSDRLR
jgi:hypothetical protein